MLGIYRIREKKIGNFKKEIYILNLDSVKLIKPDFA